MLRAGAGGPRRICPRAARRSSRPSTSASTCATSLLPLGELERILEHLREAEAPGQDARRSAAARRGSRVYMSHYLWMTGRSDGARRVRPARPGHRRRRSATFALQVAANYYLGAACLTLGRLSAGARPSAGTSMQLLEGERTPRALRPGRLSRRAVPWLSGSAPRRAGRVRRGDRPRPRKALRIAEALDHPFSLIVACSGLGYRPSRQGRARPAPSACSNAASTLCREWNLAVWLSDRSRRSWATRTRCPARRRGRRRCCEQARERHRGARDRSLPVAARRAAGRGATCWPAGSRTRAPSPSGP